MAMGSDPYFGYDNLCAYRSVIILVLLWLSNPIRLLFLQRAASPIEQNPDLSTHQIKTQPLVAVPLFQRRK